MNKVTIIGLLIFATAGGGLIWDALQPPQLNFTEPPAPHTLGVDLQQGPQHITIPQLAINQPIVPGVITNNIWSIADDSANHLATSATPGQPGNIVIYGHDDRDLFGPLQQAQVGHTITLTDHAGQDHRYRVTTRTTTDPTDVSLVQPTDHEVLTIYTCTGFANSRRLIIQATPEN